MSKYQWKTLRYDFSIQNKIALGLWMLVLIKEKVPEDLELEEKDSLVVSYYESI